MASTITDALNMLNQQGFFSYVVPFLLMFAVIYGILEKTGLFAKKRGQGQSETHESNKAVNVIIAAATSLLALQFDVVSIFFSNIFPKFGVGLAIFLVLLIILGFFYSPSDGQLKWIGWVVGIGVVLWALANWGSIYGGNFDIFYWFQEYFWALVILGIVIAVIFSVAKSKDGEGDQPRGGGRQGEG